MPKLSCICELNLIKQSNGKIKITKKPKNKIK